MIKEPEATDIDAQWKRVATVDDIKALEAQLAATEARASEYAKRVDELEKTLERVSNLVREFWEITP